MGEPASIRFNNPGAMWGKGNPIAKKWGSTSTTNLNDGLGQGNNIAFFPTKVDGACAQFDLWRSGYCGRSLKAAILKWSGGNWSQPYADFLTKQTGLSMETPITVGLLASSLGWRLMKAQAQWEAGKFYPLSDLEWQSAQSRVFNGAAKPSSTATVKKVTTGTTIVVAGAAAGAQAASSGHHWTLVVALVVGALICAAGAIWLIHRHHEKLTVAKPGDSAPPAVGGL